MIAEKIVLSNVKIRLRDSFFLFLLLFFIISHPSELNVLFTGITFFFETYFYIRRYTYNGWRRYKLIILIIITSIEFLKEWSRDRVDEIQKIQKRGKDY